VFLPVFYIEKIVKQIIISVFNISPLKTLKPIVFFNASFISLLK
jgi:hypothetical protein